MAEHRWFYQQMGVTCGPASWDAVCRVAEPDTLVRRADQDDWRTFDSVEAKETATRTPRRSGATRSEQRTHAPEQAFSSGSAGENPGARLARTATASSAPRYPNLEKYLRICQFLATVVFALVLLGLLFGGGMWIWKGVKEERTFLPSEILGPVAIWGAMHVLNFIQLIAARASLELVRVLIDIEANTRFVRSLGSQN